MRGLALPLGDRWGDCADVRGGMEMSALARDARSACVTPPMGEDARPAALADGRHRRSQTSRAAIVSACRYLMLGGYFRPSMHECCQVAKRAVRTGFDHFLSAEGLRLEAIEDGVVRDAIINRVCGGEYMPLYMIHRIVRAVVLGRA